MWKKSGELIGFWSEIVTPETLQVQPFSNNGQKKKSPPKIED